MRKGRSLGRQDVPHLGHVQWKAIYAPGTIEAHGYRNGKLILTERRETTGPAVALRLTTDRKTIAADGEDVALVSVEALDSRGRAVPTANTNLTFKVTGGDRLIGVGNGAPNCLESDKQPNRSLFNGLAQVIVQSAKRSGTIRIEALADDGTLKPAVVSVSSKSASLRPSVASTVK
jgi:beta-galactosidase